MNQKWVMLTSYDAVSARVFDHAKIPCLLVGDSGGQMVLGYKSTIPVTMDEMIPLARAVSCNTKRSFVVADLPFGSYEESPAVALRNASRFMKEAGVHGVKLEGGKEFASHVELLTHAGIPVMGHIGFTPQSEHMLSGFKIQGRSEEAVNKLVEDALALEKAGAFACVLELVPRNVGELVTKRLTIPTVGIGAGPECDAQVLVWNDMAGFTAPKSSESFGYLNDKPANVDSNRPNDAESSSNSSFELERVPKFVKRYANLSESLYNAAKQFSQDVYNGSYPAEEHCYK